MCGSEERQKSGGTSSDRCPRAAAPPIGEHGAHTIKVVEHLARALQEYLSGSSKSDEAF
jgi:hypothetical protein